MKINKLKSKMVMDPSDYMKVFHLDSLPKLDKPVVVTFNQDMYQYIRGLNLEENKAGETLQQDKYFDKIDDIIRVANGASGNREEQRTSWNNTIREQLFNLAEEDFRKFSSKLLPGIDNIIGVRFNYLRKMAKRIVKKDWKMYLANASDEYFEEVMLQGMTIGYVNVEVKELQFLITNFIMKIDNWSVCDSFCSGLKITKKYQDEMWEYIENCCYSVREFTCRFGLVMLLDYYLEEKYLDQVFKIIDSIEHEGYYAKMANAWLLSIIYINFPQRTEEYLKVSKLDNETYNKAISKILDSKRIGKETKNKIIKLRRI